MVSTWEVSPFSFVLVVFYYATMVIFLWSLLLVMHIITSKMYGYLREANPFSFVLILVWLLLFFYYATVVIILCMTVVIFLWGLLLVMHIITSKMYGDLREVIHLLGGQTYVKEGEMETWRRSDTCLD